MAQMREPNLTLGLRRTRNVHLDTGTQSGDVVLRPCSRDGAKPALVLGTNILVLDLVPSLALWHPRPSVAPTSVVEERADLNRCLRVLRTAPSESDALLTRARLEIWFQGEDCLGAGERDAQSAGAIVDPLGRRDGDRGDPQDK